MTMMLPHFYRVYVASNCRSMVYEVTRVHTRERARYTKGVLTKAPPASFEHRRMANFAEGDGSAK